MAIRRKFRVENLIWVIFISRLKYQFCRQPETTNRKKEIHPLNVSYVTFNFPSNYQTTVHCQKDEHMLFFDKTVKNYNFVKCSWICVRNTNKFFWPEGFGYKCIFHLYKVIFRFEKKISKKKYYCRRLTNPQMK